MPLKTMLENYASFSFKQNVRYLKKYFSDFKIFAMELKEL